MEYHDNYIVMVYILYSSIAVVLVIIYIIYIYIHTYINIVCVECVGYAIYIYILVTYNMIHYLYLPVLPQALAPTDALRERPVNSFQEQILRLSWVVKV